MKVVSLVLSNTVHLVQSSPNSPKRTSQALPNSREPPVTGAPSPITYHRPRPAPIPRIPPRWLASKARRTPSPLINTFPSDLNLTPTPRPQPTTATSGGCAKKRTITPGNTCWPNLGPPLQRGVRFAFIYRAMGSVRSGYLFGTTMERRTRESCCPRCGGRPPGCKRT